MNTQRLRTLMTGLLLIAPYSCHAIHVFNNPTFYQANYFFGEPQFEKPCLTAIDFLVYGGSTSCARNKFGNKVCLLSLYGPEHMASLANNLPAKNGSVAYDLLKTLNALPPLNGFAQLAFSGSVSVLNTVALVTQNLDKGFFVQVHVPCVQLHVHNLFHHDASCTTQVSPEHQLAWAQVLQNISNILSDYKLEQTRTQGLQLGDVSLYVGWAHNYQDTERIDYIDTTAKLGVVLPTSGKKNENILFDFPVGYNGFTGLSVSGDVSLGAYEWLTVGAHARGIFFIKKHRHVRMKTSIEQNGFIKLLAGQAVLAHGSIIEAGTFVKADHIIRGFSLLVGYTFTKKERGGIRSFGKDVQGNVYSEQFPQNVIITDTSSLSSWDMHTLNYIAEYDFNQEDTAVGTRLSLYVNQQIGGANVFATNTAGAGIGFDITW